MEKKLLVLGADNVRMDLIVCAKKMGCTVYACSGSYTDKGISAADYFEQMDVADTDKITRYVRDNKIDCIYSVGNGAAVTTLAKAAEIQNLFHFVSGETADICSQKHRMREALGKNFRFQVPFSVCETLAEARCAGFFPLTVSPIDSRGQKEVFRAENAEELSLRFSDAMRLSRCRKVLLEKCISGDCVSVNAYMKDGKMIFFMLSDREAVSDLSGGTTTAYHIPSKYEGKKVHSEIHELARYVTNKLEIRNGPVCFEITVSENTPYLNEVTPCLDGSHLWRLIYRYCGVNLLEMTVSHLLSENGPDMPMAEKKKASWHLEFFCEKPGTVFNAEKYKNYTAEYKEMYYHTGDTVKNGREEKEKCGYRIFRSPKRVALIGGSGRIGSAFQQMYRDNLLLRDISRKSQFIKEYSAPQLREALRDCDTAVIMAAKKGSPDEKQSWTLYDDNVTILEAALNACIESGIRNIVFLSSRCVYSDVQKTPLAEKSTIAPINLYGISKYTCELLCGYYNRVYGTNIKILRLAQVIVHDVSARTVMSGAESEAAADMRDCIHIKDACRAIRLVLDQYADCGVYDIGARRESAVSESEKPVADALFSDAEAPHERKENGSAYFSDTKKAKESFGFEIRYGFPNVFAEPKKDRSSVNENFA